MKHYLPHIKRFLPLLAFLLFPMADVSDARGSYWDPMTGDSAFGYYYEYQDGNGDWHTDSNWSASLTNPDSHIAPPDYNDRAVFTNGGDVDFFDNYNARNGNQYFESKVLMLRSGSLTLHIKDENLGQLRSWHLLGGNLSIGTLNIGNYGTASLTLDAGTLDTTSGSNHGWGTAAYIGASNTTNYFGGTGTMTVIGNEAQWLADDIVVGFVGDGVLNIKNQGTVDSGYAILGNANGSTGTVNVTGYGSTWTAGGLEVGNGGTQSGTGILHIKNGGKVTSTWTVRIGTNSNGIGTMVVDGSDGNGHASLLAVTNGDDLYVGNDGADGLLTVQNGGKVDIATDGDRTFIGNGVNSEGYLTVTGAGSTFDSNIIYVGLGADANGSPDPGGYGEILLDDGATMNTGSILIGNLGYHLYGSYTPGSGKMTVDNGAVLNSNAITVGRFGEGWLDIKGSSAVTLDNGLIVGYQKSYGSNDQYAEKSGHVTVSGVGTTLDIHTGLEVSKGSLSITDGAVVTTNIDAASVYGLYDVMRVGGDDSDGQIIVSGNGSKLVQKGPHYQGENVFISVGYLYTSVPVTGTGLLRVENGGEVSTQRQVQVHKNGTLEIDNAILDGKQLLVSPGGRVLIKDNTAGSVVFTEDAIVGDTNATTDSAVLALDQGYLTANSLTVNGNGEIQGIGTINSAVTINSGGVLNPGAVGTYGALIIEDNLTLKDGSILEYNIGPPSPTNPDTTLGTSDHITVNGALTLAHGTTGISLNLSDPNGKMARGLYSLIDYGTLSGDVADINLASVPSGVDASKLTLSDNSAQTRIELFYDIAAGNFSIWAPTSAAAPGGSGNWSVTSTTWTTINGDPLAAMAPQPGFAIFKGTPGIVTVLNTPDGNVQATGMQFAADGYILEGMALTLVKDGANAPQIRVGDGTTAGENWLALVNNKLAGSDGFVKTDFGAVIINSQSIDLTGDIQVQAGVLGVGDGSHTSAVLGDSASTLTVASNAWLAGHGTLGGAVTIGAGGTLQPGDPAGHFGTLTVNGDLTLNDGSILDFDLGAPDATDPDNTPGASDHVAVGGALTIQSGSQGVTLNLSDPNSTLGQGLYSLIDYGTLSGNVSDIQVGAVPSSTAVSDFTLSDNTGAKRIELYYGVALADHVIWAPTSASAPGGDGTWSTTSATWTTINGDPLAAMSPQPGFAIFKGAPGTVVVDNSAGSVQVTGMQFAVDNYTLDGDVLTLVQSGGNAPVIRVGDGTNNAGSGMEAFIRAPLAGSNGFVKTDRGALLIYSDSSTLTGTIQIQSGVLGLFNLNSGGQAGGILGDSHSTVIVEANALFLGDGTVGGDLTINQDGHLQPGDPAAHFGTLTVNGDLTLKDGSILEFDLGAPSDYQPDHTPGTSDHVAVGGALVIQAGPQHVTLNLSDPNNTLGQGLYSLIDYGTLSGNVSDIQVGAVPGTTLASDFTLSNNTSVGQIELYYGVAATDFNIWAPTSASAPGGDGTWSTTSATWTTINGDPLAAMDPQPGFAIFKGTPGTVTVDNTAGAVQATGLQFAVDGYALDGDVLTLVADGGNAPVIRVGDGTNASASWAAVINNELAGTDGLTKTGFGILALAGSNSYSGTTTVQAGTLALGADNTLSSQTDVRVIDGATLNLRNYHDTVQSLVLKSGATLGVELDAQTKTSGKLTTTAAATLEDGSLIKASIVNSEDIVTGDTWTIIHADGGLTDQGANVLEPDLDVSLTGYTFTLTGLASSNDYQLQAHLDQIPLIDGDPTAQAAWDALIEDSQKPGTDPDLIQYMNYVAQDLNPTEQLSAALSLAPRQLGAVQSVSANLQRSFYNTLGSHLASMRLGAPGASQAARSLNPLGMQLASATNNPQLIQAMVAANGYLADQGQDKLSDASVKAQSRWGGFFTGYGVFTDRESYDSVVGFNAKTGAAQAGLDYQLNDNWLVGASFGYAHSDISFAGGTLGSATMDSYRFGPYVSYHSGAYFAHAAMSYAAQPTDNTRVVTGGGSYDSEYTASDFTVRLGGGMEIEAGPWRIVPRADLQYAHSWTGSYQETGGGLGLAVDPQNFDSLRSDLGVRLARAFYFDQYNKLVPFISAGWSHEYLDTSSQVTSHYVGGSTPFTVNVVGGDRDIFTYGAGVAAIFQEGWTISLNYNGELSSHENTNAVIASVKFGF